METDVYQTLRARIQLFTSVVGRLQPILSLLPARIAETTLAAPHERARARANLVATLEASVAQGSPDAFDIDEAADATLEAQPFPAPPYGLDDLARLMDRRELLPDGVEAVRTSSKEVFWTEPGRAQIAVTTDSDFFEQHPESVEFWTPGSPVFPGPMPQQDGPDAPAFESLEDILNR